MRLNIAIDGPAGAGKSTIAKLVAKKFRLMYINTGAMYRAVTLMAMRQNIRANDVKKLCDLIESLSMHFENDKLIVNGEDVSEEILLPKTSQNVSDYASVLEVREKLVYLQKKMAGRYDVVMDGRDIGTVVLNDAPFKFYLTATPEERAKRRYKELSAKNIKVCYDDILNDIIRRDYIDSNREVNPLTKAYDAVEIDSSNMCIEEVVDYIVQYISKKI
ncbi:cytidylate kinase [Clostridium acetobutylicum]|uniref:Cytidylate kinase n=1 Tax=Clostridium acetobutylicum (strain ATCC 824 / DSM 792 / JCM 1419 / IAM 19013 / LMG 5710 / NBRC 13948 / NRRL B-527 / VKM B-1787 / 2291 / W) TaxID=272562 RepID=KCY_CLOAB|nr:MULTISPECIES: (d)CMP kinase [Clostridium]Q97I08.1 RecName: Full=Cytidylate kinase; Short=CK; AltName: Full=Cytidine monophosphate kinase; Short=CMP kinase [Clostridium acetobutylicum ATCC 824]AAK79812.1 Cytidylate kinase [Clostridium acetobutylicum ATCC 824]ADZ20898.1 cytidylate kinase [Clostridium acetobutylicum EA 2018]AEI33690.1 cytidylate kinase [Clostridium acetobutylicum DSM 1731]AWV79755.1 (d)CMP kinase [Clostridium acetobutylicum]KHD38139.1 cytidylate kinase [Clostridium acetobutyl